MKPGIHQTGSLRQELRINPRLYQAMDLLTMPLLDLQQHLKQELLTNPFLDLVEPGEDEEQTEEEAAAEEAEAQPDSAETAEAKEKAEEEGIDWEEILLNGFDVGGGRVAEREDREWSEPVTVEKRHLSDHLADQIKMLDLSDRQHVLAEEFVGDINDDGYLAVSLEELRRDVNKWIEDAAAAAGREDEELPLYTEAEVEAMLAIIQNLDPPGTGARDLRECLLLQLRAAKQEESLAYRLVRDHYDELINHRWTEISKKTALSQTEVQRAADEVAKRDPKPGLRYSSAGDNYIVPDLIVDKIDGAYQVFVNDNNVPRLRLSRAYQDIARDKKKFDGANKDFIATRLNAANWMIQALEQRRQTMLKVMHFIVDRQRDYFDKGLQYLKPLTLREVAEGIGMHESTISRVTNEKFVQTPRGVLPLKFFFSSGLSTAGGEDVSARGIKAQLEKRITEEDPKHPLTDQDLVDMFEKDGVKIARRTVAKYREQLGVLSARMRRRV
jgi:RNA polymerase sigma-54 factor